MNDTFDIAVLGGGPGGYVAAIRSAQLGMKTALIESQHLGGICLNWGCIPTKALLRTAELYRNFEESEKFGITVSGLSFDIEKIVKRSRNVAGRLSEGISHLLNKNSVKVFEARGALSGSGKLSLEDKNGVQTNLSCNNIIIATGARPRVLKGLEPDGKLVWSYKEAMTPDLVPDSLLVIGSGAIGIEFASFFNTFGCKVTVVEMLSNILPAEDEEISSFAKGKFEKQGIDIMTSSQVLNLVKGDNKVSAIIETNGKRIEKEFDRVIVAVGVVGNTEELGLETTKVQVADGGYIQTNNWGCTDEPHVYAIGDVAGPPWLAHKASHEGIVCVENISGNGSHSLNKENIPGCTYCHPQIASIGLTEAQAKEAGREIRVGRFPFLGNGKAIALGEDQGIVKTIFDSVTGELLGAHMVGSEVTELVQGFSISKTLEATELELIHTVFPHPTLSEMMHESVLDAYGRAIHF